MAGFPFFCLVASFCARQYMSSDRTGKIPRVFELAQRFQLGRKTPTPEESASLSPLERKFLHDIVLSTKFGYTEVLKHIDKGGIELSKEELRESHLTGLRQYTTRTSDKQYTNVLTPGIDEIAAKHVCTLEAKNLTPIGIQELSKGTINKSKFLWVTTVEPCYKISAIQLLVQDDFGRLALLGLYNFMPSTGTSFDAQVLFPVGTRLGIKEPYYKVLNSGCYGLRVDNPCNVIVDRSSLYDSMSTGAIKTEGDKGFAEKKYARAEELYGFALSREPGYVSQLPLLLTRAATRLGMSNYAGALADSEAALALDENNIKAQFRRAQALFGLMRYTEAVDVYATLMGREPNERIFVQEHGKAMAAIKQSAGDYDLLTFPFDPSMQTETDVAEFFGPIEVRYTKDKNKGRGLFLTENVVAGQILFVERSLMYCLEDPSTVVLAVNVQDKSVNKGTSHGLVNDLVLLASQSPKANSLLSHLSTGAEGVRLPLLDIDALRPGKAGLPCTPPVSADDVRGIVKVNAFGFKVCKEPSVEKRKSIQRAMSQPVPFEVERSQRFVMVKPVTKLMQILSRSTSPKQEDIAAAINTTDTAEIRAVDPNGQTALHLAVIRGNAKAVEMLLEAGAQVDAADERGLTPLHQAAGESFHPDIMRALIRHGANVNAQTPCGFVPLSVSIIFDIVEAVQFLLEHGADPTIEDHDQGLSPLDHIRRESERMKDIFAKAGHSTPTDGSGVWPVASMMNHHSSAVNTRRRFVGRMMFVTAARELKAGVELTTSYAFEKQKLRQWNIDE